MKTDEFDGALMPTEEEADVELRAHGLDPDEVGRRGVDFVERCRKAPFEGLEDPIGVAIDEGVARFGERADGLFNSAGFGIALMRLAGLRGVLDGNLGLCP